MGYAGGKGRLWQELVALMPPHDIYIETHLGGGAVVQRKRPARQSFGVDIDSAVIAAAHEWCVPDLSLHHGDAVAFLTSRPWGTDTLVYADPPYMASTKANRRYYRHEYSDEDHETLLATLERLPCAVMISGYRSALYDETLRDWDRRDLVNVTHTGLKVESVWANFSFSDHLHDYSTVGGDFRERDRIKRKVARWVRKLELMPPLEQQAILNALIKAQISGGHANMHVPVYVGGGQDQ